MKKDGHFHVKVGCFPHHGTIVANEGFNPWGFNLATKHVRNNNPCGDDCKLHPRGDHQIQGFG